MKEFLYQSCNKSHGVYCLKEWADPTSEIPSQSDRNYIVVSIIEGFELLLGQILTMPPPMPSSVVVGVTLCAHCLIDPTRRTAHI